MPCLLMPRTIEDFLGDQAVGNEELGPLLKICLLRALSKELTQQTFPENLLPVRRLPANSPAWVRKAQDEGRILYLFSPMGQMLDDIRHVRDWIASAIVQQPDWLKNTDDQGRPKKLRKIGSLAQAVAEADKDMARALQKMASISRDNPADISKVMTFDDGYYIAHLLTADALDWESCAMGHCVGQGYYDESLERVDAFFFSLRDPTGRSHVTLEVTTSDYVVKQCRGKQNQIPAKKYVSYILSFIEREKFRLDAESSRYCGLISINGKYDSVYDLPDNWICDGHLNLINTPIKSLPKGLVVKGNLSLWGSLIETLPDDIWVQGNLNLVNTPVVVIPSGIHVGGYLMIAYTEIKDLPPHISPRKVFPIPRSVRQVLEQKTDALKSPAVSGKETNIADILKNDVNKASGHHE